MIKSGYLWCLLFGKFPGYVIDQYNTRRLVTPIRKAVPKETRMSVVIFSYARPAKEHHQQEHPDIVTFFLAHITIVVVVILLACITGRIRRNAVEEEEEDE